MANNIDTLRDHLFEMIEALKDKENPIEIERAMAVSTVCQTVINSLKAEVEARKLAGIDGRLPFIESEEVTERLPPTLGIGLTSTGVFSKNFEPGVKPGPGITIHKNE